MIVYNLNSRFSKISAGFDEIFSGVGTTREVNMQIRGDKIFPCHAREIFFARPEPRTLKNFFARSVKLFGKVELVSANFIACLAKCAVS